jgi:hypothetical protein
MKNLFVITTLGLLSLLSVSSCENESAVSSSDEFGILFNDGTAITMDDILFYDSSTHLVYLKSGLELNPGITDFYVSVAGDTIYHGIIYSCLLSSMPPSPYFILDCFQYGNKIIEIGYIGEESDLRNDPGIITALKNSNRLRNGLSVTLDNVDIQSFENHSRVTCTVTVQNNDNQNYYILDPGKMGDLDFSYFTGGVLLQNRDTRDTYPLKWSVQSGTWSNINIEDMSLLRKGSKVTYTFRSSDYNKMEAGRYSARFRFCGTEHCTSGLNLNQKEGRIWVGSILLTADDILVENQ